MKKYIIALGALVALAVPAAAMADVPRYQPEPQPQAGKLTVNLPEYGLVHTFDVVVSPSGSFSATGVSNQGHSFGPVTETIVGSLNNGELSFEATYNGAAAELHPGYKWWTTSSNTAQDTLGSGNPSFQVTWTLDLTESASPSYKNHGDYVSQMGGGDEAAHSPIGKPIKAKSK